MIKLVESLKILRDMAASETPGAVSWLDKAINLAESELICLSDCPQWGDYFHDHVSADKRWCIRTQSDYQGCRTVVYDVVMKRQIESYDTDLKHPFFRTAKQLHEMACMIWNNK